MKKSKIATKFILYFSLLTSLTIFVFFLLGIYLIQVINSSIFYQILIILALSLFVAIINIYGLSIIFPAIGNTMLGLKRLQRFESLSNPLLTRLLINAPGTYHHSLNVSILAERACKSIDADAFLVRTAAYYHDIGKLEKPMLFIENQAVSEIPKDESADGIRESAKKIITHVEAGIKIAKENNLPVNIINLIAEHHGTTRVWYFYRQALERGLKIKRTDFRYPGPIPQGIESVILMIADCVEAAVRAEQMLTKESLPKIADSVIKERLGDKQFKNARVSESDLVKIKNSLTKTLQSIYHQRINH